MNTPIEISNETLLANYYQGDLYAFEKLWKELGDDLYNIAFKLTCRDRRAEDYCHQAWEEILKNRDKYLGKIHEGTLDLKSYMIRIIRNKYIDELRSIGRYEDLPIEETLEESVTLNPGSKLELEQMLKNIEKCLAKLKAIYREVYVLTRVAGYSLEEAAKLIDVNPETAKTRRRVSYKHMKACLKKQKEESSDEFVVTLFQSSRIDSVPKDTSVEERNLSEEDFPGDKIIDTMIIRSYKQAPIMLKKTLFKFL